MPEAEGKIELFAGPGVLFDMYDLEEEIERLTSPRVPLPSGGWITIEGTEALTAIDVNSGSFTASTGLEETSLKVNLEAADEIGRQLRLRGIGGLIVDRFHSSEAPDNIQNVLDVLAAQSGERPHADADSAGCRSSGLVEITRKRIRDPLVKLMTECCRPARPRPQAHARQRGDGSAAPRRARGGGATPGKRIRCARLARNRRLAGRSRRGSAPALARRRGAARVSLEARERIRARRFRCRNGRLI